MPEPDEFAFRLVMVLVLVLGSLIGVEREYRSKSAGFRTMMLICLGFMLFTTFPFISAMQT